MQEIGVKDFIKEYIDWIKNNSAQIQINDYVEISTPFLDSHNDYLQLYIKHEGDRYILTDDGAVINDLIMNGCDVSTKKRREMINQLAASLGVTIKGKEIQTEASVGNIAQKQHSMYQAMLKIGDVFMSSSSRVRGLFFDEIESYFIENDVRYSQSVLLMGTSGLTHRFDFIVSASRRKPERVITALNTPDRQNIESALFSWEDTKKMRKKDSKSYIILNNIKKPVASEYKAAISSYGITPIPWSDRDDFIEELVG